MWRVVLVWIVFVPMSQASKLDPEFARESLTPIRRRTQKEESFDLITPSRLRDSLGDVLFKPSLFQCCERFNNLDRAFDRNVGIENKG